MEEASPGTLLKRLESLMMLLKTKYRSTIGIVLLWDQNKFD
jgi:hypothetical protein